MGTIGKDTNADPEKNLSYNVVTHLSNDLCGNKYQIFWQLL